MVVFSENVFQQEDQWEATLDHRQSSYIERAEEGEGVANLRWGGIEHAIYGPGTCYLPGGQPHTVSSWHPYKRYAYAGQKEQLGSLLQLLNDSKGRIGRHHKY